MFLAAFRLIFGVCIAKIITLQEHKKFVQKFKISAHEEFFTCGSPCWVLFVLFAQTSGTTYGEPSGAERLGQAGPTNPLPPPLLCPRISCCQAPSRCLLLGAKLILPDAGVAGREPVSEFGPVVSMES